MSETKAPERIWIPLDAAQGWAKPEIRESEDIEYVLARTVEVRKAAAGLAEKIYDALAVNDDINCWHKDRLLPMITEIISKHFPSAG